VATSSMLDGRRYTTRALAPPAGSFQEGRQQPARLGTDWIDLYRCQPGTTTGSIMDETSGAHDLVQAGNGALHRRARPSRRT